MRFSIHNMMWLTAAVAIVSLFVHLFGASHYAVVGVWLVALYVFAPLFLALFLSFFQKVDARWRIAIAFMSLAFVALTSIFVFPPYLPPSILLGLMIGGLGIWIVQIDILFEIYLPKDDEHF